MDINWDTYLLAPLQNVFGEPVNYRPTVGSAYDITGVFDRAYTQDVEPVNPGDPSINTTLPVLGTREAIFTAYPVKGDRLYVYSVDTLFIVRDIRTDSHGGIKLILNRAAS
jgi:hypothetical protein